MISNKRVACLNVQRKAYLFYHGRDMCKSRLIGEFFEQENDAGEVQYLFKINNSVIADDEVDKICLPGIDLSFRLDEYVRSGGIPYFVECCTIPDGRGDLKRFLDLVEMDFNDKFEFMLRTRAVTHHSNCYLGRTPDDTIDLNKYKEWGEYQKTHFPNLPCGNYENDFHEINKETDHSKT